MAKAADSRAILCHERKRNRTGKPRGGSFRDRMGGGRREGGRDSSCYGSQKPPHPPALCQPVPPPRCSLSGPAAHPLVRHPGCLARLFCLSDLPVALLLSQLLPPRCPCPPPTLPRTPTPPHPPTPPPLAWWTACGSPRLFWLPFSIRLPKRGACAAQLVKQLSG